MFYVLCRNWCAFDDSVYHKIRSKQNNKSYYKTIRGTNMLQKDNILKMFAAHSAYPRVDFLHIII